MAKLSFRIFFLVLFFQSHSMLFAQLLLTKFNQLEGTLEQQVLVKSAQFIAIDYDLIKHDFPWMRNWSDQKIEMSFLKNVVSVSIEQSRQTIVNTPIETTGELINGIRPPEYRRAFVTKLTNPLESKQSVLIDTKGGGTLAAPKLGYHSDGLMPLSSALREYLFEKQIVEIFKAYYPHLMTVKTYGVIDLGFKIKNQQTGLVKFRASLILRQAHRRYYSRNPGDNITMPSVLPREKQLEFELALRRFGITSSTDIHNQIMNIQGTEDGRLVDFGGMRVVKKFTGPIYSYYEGKDHDEEVLMLEEANPNYMQPDPKLRLRRRYWGSLSNYKFTSSRTQPSLISMDLIGLNTPTIRLMFQKLYAVKVRDFFQEVECEKRLMNKTLK